PSSGRTVGVVASVRHAHEASRLMLTVARQAGRDVERRLGDATSQRERFLRHVFDQAVRRTRGPLALVAPDVVLVNAAAAHVIGAADETARGPFVAGAARAPR